MTVQRVTGPRGAGINGYVHDGSVTPDLEWSDLDRGAYELGNLIRRDEAVSGGGNRVTSYLDIVSQQALSVDQVGAILARHPDKSGDRRWSWRTDLAAARFQLCGGAGEVGPIAQEFDGLRERALSLLGSSMQSEPIEIVRRVTSGGLVFELTQKSVARLRCRHGPAWRPTRVRVSQEVIAAWKAFGLTRLDDEVVGALTGLGESEIQHEGGITVKSQ